MKKTAIVIISAVLLLVIIIFGLLFTQPGNNIIKPVIESKLNANLTQKIKLETFSLRPSTFKIKLILGKDSYISAKGNYGLFTKTIDAEYDIKIAQLENISPITKMNLRGPFSTGGYIKGSKKLMNISGTSNLALSRTDYHLTIKKLKIASIDMSMKNAKLEKILYMLNKPQYAEANLNINAKLSGMESKKTNGRIISALSSGYFNSGVIKKRLDLTMPQTTFNVSAYTDVKNSEAISRIKANSSIAKLIINKMIFQMNSSTLKSDYKLIVPNLDKLYFVTNQHLRGNITINGNIEKDKNFIVTADSNTLGGKANLKLFGSKATAAIRNIQAVKLTNMLMYPRIFDSRLNADAVYSLKTKKGTINANLINGHILPNKMTFLLRHMARFDITREIYKKTNIVSRINDKIITSDLDMESRLTHITSKDAVVDMKNRKVDAKLRVDIKKKPVYVKIKGDINHPEVKLDVKALFMKKIQKKINKQIPKGINNIINKFQ